MAICGKWMTVGRGRRHRRAAMNTNTFNSRLNLVVFKGVGACPDR